TGSKRPRYAELVFHPLCREDDGVTLLDAVQLINEKPERDHESKNPDWSQDTLKERVSRSAVHRRGSRAIAQNVFVQEEEDSTGAGGRQQPQQCGTKAVDGIVILTELVVDSLQIVILVACYTRGVSGLVGCFAHGLGLSFKPHSEAEKELGANSGRWLSASHNISGISLQMLPPLSRSLFSFFFLLHYCSTPIQGNRGTTETPSTQRAISG